MTNSIIFEYIIIIILLMVIAITFVENILLKNNKTKNYITINSDTTNMFINELDKIILYNTVYNIDVMFGNNFSNKKAVTADIENEDLIDAVNKIEENVINDMGDTMKEYLYNIFGKDWIYRYINIQTLSLSLNYTKLNINQLTRNLF